MDLPTPSLPRVKAQLCAAWASGSPAHLIPLTHTTCFQGVRSHPSTTTGLLNSRIGAPCEFRARCSCKPLTLYVPHCVRYHVFLVKWPRRPLPKTVLCPPQTGAVTASSGCNEPHGRQCHARYHNDQLDGHHHRHLSHLLWQGHPIEWQDPGELSTQSCLALCIASRLLAVTHSLGSANVDNRSRRPYRAR